MPLSENELMTLFHQTEAPPMQADPVRVVAGGKARVRRRRVVAGTLGAAGVALLAGSIALAQVLSPDAATPVPVAGTTQQAPTPTPLPSATTVQEVPPSPVPLQRGEGFLDADGFGSGDAAPSLLPALIVRQNAPGGTIVVETLEQRDGGWVRSVLPGVETAVPGVWLFFTPTAGIVVAEQPDDARVILLRPIEREGVSISASAPLEGTARTLYVARGSAWGSPADVLDALVVRPAGEVTSLRGQPVTSGGTMASMAIFHSASGQVVRIAGPRQFTSALPAFDTLHVVSTGAMSGTQAPDILAECRLPAGATDFELLWTDGAQHPGYFVLTLPDGLGELLVAHGAAPAKEGSVGSIEMTLSYSDSEGVRHTVEPSGPQS